ncbi:MAG: flagellar export protein FliJ [Butyricicoccus sp.]|nr:flagellar export protein FliJ [Butyricicoccus sp.]
MKKFTFSLDSVLSFKQQALDALRGEHAMILMQVREQEEKLEAVKNEYRDYNGEYCRRKAEGMTITDAMMYEGGLRVLERDIERETERLAQIRKLEEAKREEVIEAKKETSSLEKLKDKKLDLYQKAVQKSEETFIEEFVVSARSRSTA